MFCIIYRFHGSKSNQRLTNWEGLVVFNSEAEALAVCAKMLNPHSCEMAIPHYMG